jgi:hypothetical protein
MNAPSIPTWLDQEIWPQIQTMMLNDAYFKLMCHARELTGEFNGPIAALIDAKSTNLAPAGEIDNLLSRFDSCDPVCRLVNDYVAHTANPLRRPNLSDWNLQMQQLVEAQKAICEIAITLDRELLRRKNYVKIIPVPQFDIMLEFRRWVPSDTIKALWEFWHSHNDEVNSWIP